MKRRILFISLQHDRSLSIGLILCGAMFLCGCIIGTVAAGAISSADQLGETINGYLSVFSSGMPSQPDFFSAALNAFKYQLAAVFLGCSIFGVVCIPLLSAVRGFFLCFSVSAFVRTLGGKGILLSLSVFGLDALITIPCFFILAVSAFSASHYISKMALSKNKKPGIPFSSNILVVCGICFMLLVLSALIDTYLTPSLISYTASKIPT